MHDPDQARRASNCYANQLVMSRTRVRSLLERQNFRQPDSAPLRRRGLPNEVSISQRDAAPVLSAAGAALLREITLGDAMTFSAGAGDFEPHEHTQ